MKGRAGRQKGRWRGKVYSLNGKMLVTTSEAYCNRKECERALKKAAATICQYYDL